MIEQKIANQIYFLSRQSCPYFHCLHISRWPPRSSAIVTANCHIIYRSLKCDTLSYENQILHANEENNISYQFKVVSVTNSVINTKKNGIVSGTKPRKIFPVVARMYTVYSGRCSQQSQVTRWRWQVTTPGQSYSGRLSQSGSTLWVSSLKEGWIKYHKHGWFYLKIIENGNWHSLLSQESRIDFF